MERTVSGRREAISLLLALIMGPFPLCRRIGPERHIVGTWHGVRPPEEGGFRGDGLSNQCGKEFPSHPEI